ncbi:MAG: glycosyltransferase family 1 protein [Clostridia bacterium]|nr:glycosyltransferase family 1 protein [Clostridia bacterium]MBR2175549.1 glycosyltransferase family 1 protein [Clostridia bacterium]
MKTDEVPRILQLNSGSGDFGGVSSFLYNVYTHIDRDKIQFDFISPNITTYGIHREEIENMGGRIYELGITGNILTRKLKLYRELKKFLNNHDYRIIHINSGNFFFNLFAVSAAKKAGIEFRIVHSHNAGDTNHSIFKRILFNILKPSLEKKATELYACSEKAAQYMFTKKSNENRKVSIIKNGIQIERFVFDAQVREQLKNDLRINDKIVIGHVGRFLEQKNHEFLIKIFAEIHKENNNTVLFLFGSGEKQEKIQQLVKEEELEDCVRFMGVIGDIEKMYQIMDVFVMPSFHEGLPVTCIEVQVNGMPCVLSDSITSEVKINENVLFVSLKESPQFWAHKVLSALESGRADNCDKIENSGYSIDSVAKNLRDRYFVMLNGR